MRFCGRHCAGVCLRQYTLRILHIRIYNELFIIDKMEAKFTIISAIASYLADMKARVHIRKLLVFGIPLGIAFGIYIKQG